MLEVRLSLRLLIAYPYIHIDRDTRLEVVIGQLITVESGSN